MLRVTTGLPPRDHGLIREQARTTAHDRAPNRGRWAAWERWSRLERPSEGRVLAGVATSLAGPLGVTPVAARAALVALCFAGGAGFAIYVAGWLLLPPANGVPTIAQEAWADTRTRSLVLAAASLLVVLLATVDALGGDVLFGAVSPGLVALAGLVAVWRHARAEDKLAVQRLVGLVGPRSGAGAPEQERRRVAVVVARLGLGLALVAVGASAVLGPRHFNGADVTAAIDAVAVVAGFALVLAPWWLRLGRELADERRERLRAQERAEMAEHIHDSVLQTLALIQRSAEDPHKVVNLARAQERQLRRWLFDKAVADDLAHSDDATLSEAMATLQRDVEADHGVKVEVVNVGDAAMDGDLRAMVSAAREAVVNAAKWSGAAQVSVFCEAEPDHVSIFVLDRGGGFDPAQVAPDRRGISESIQARMSRKGGTAKVRSALGEGTEVTLRMPRRPAP